MPIGAPQLSDDELADIRSWIQDGAAPALHAATFAGTTSTTLAGALHDAGSEGN